ncbi:MAG TPA: DUF5329 family protein [Thermoanaerobaculia bacterium]
MDRKPAAAALLALVLAQPGFAAALRPPEEQARIDFLIGEVKKSNDVFIRNGKEYSGNRAASHLSMKLRFAGRRIQTAMDFVLGVASKSEESGKLYEVRSRQGHREPLRDWLLARLQLHEKSQPGGPKPAVTPPAIP